LSVHEALVVVYALAELLLHVLGGLLKGTALVDHLRHVRLRVRGRCVVLEDAHVLLPGDRVLAGVVPSHRLLVLDGGRDDALDSALADDADLGSVIFFEELFDVG